MLGAATDRIGKGKREKERKITICSKLLGKRDEISVFKDCLTNQSRVRKAYIVP